MPCYKNSPQNLKKKILTSYRYRATRVTISVQWWIAEVCLARGGCSREHFQIGVWNHAFMTNKSFSLQTTTRSRSILSLSDSVAELEIGKWWYILLQLCMQIFISAKVGPLCLLELRWEAAGLLLLLLLFSQVFWSQIKSTVGSPDLLWSEIS